MKRYLLKWLLIFVVFIPGRVLGERPEISLITCSSGSELYSIFGHSALRAWYPQSGRDLVFNFGLFDFNTPNFYSKFVKGQLKYLLGIQTMPDFMEQYRWENRGVKEQKLNLTDEQNDKIMARLEYLYRPENRYYLYSFLYKNCTSELRDIIYSVTDSNRELLSKSAQVTDRDLINGYINGWTKFGINLILGSTLDREIDLRQSMFLPENLYSVLAQSQNGKEPFVAKEIVLIEDNQISEKSGGFWNLITTPVLILLLLLVVVVLLFFKKGSPGWAGNLYVTLISALGALLTIIILITEHRELYSNYNLLWCNPLYILVVIASLGGWKKTERVLAAISLVSLATLQIVWAQKIQYAEPGFVVIVITLAFIFIGRILGKRGK
ncbi:MAG: DUF4105 domain-containing protein [Bacteroidales bacterium]|nr:DUF4105 domain-containing protein [Bacteroidales bacterium]